MKDLSCLYRPRNSLSLGTPVTLVNVSHSQVRPRTLQNVLASLIGLLEEGEGTFFTKRVRATIAPINHPRPDIWTAMFSFWMN